MALENNQIENSNISNDEISFKEIIFIIKEWAGFLKSKWKLFFLAGIIGGLVGITIAICDKPTYKAALTFVMEEEKSAGIGGAASIASSLGIDLGGGGGGGIFTAVNIAELMKSRLIVFKVLLKPIKINGETTTLAEYYIQINKLRNEWITKPSFSKINYLPGSDPSKFSLEQNIVLMGIHRSLIRKDYLSIMQKDKKVSILSIEVSSEDEIFSKIFCENLAKEASEFYIETKSKKARNNLEILQKQLDSVKSALNFHIAGAASAIDNIYNLNPALNLKGASIKEKQIDVQANTAVFTNLVAQLEIAKITLRKETPLIQLVDQPILPLEINKLSFSKSFIFGSFFTMVILLLFLTLKRFFNQLDYKD
jgi:hypothetical protein